MSKRKRYDYASAVWAEDEYPKAKRILRKLVREAVCATVESIDAVPVSDRATQLRADRIAKELIP